MKTLSRVLRRSNQGLLHLLVDFLEKSDKLDRMILQETLMRGISSLLLAGLALCGPAWAGALDPAPGFRNGGFEKGDFAGWVLNAPYTEVISQDYDGFAPHKGSNYALLGARGADGTLSQSFLDVAGETLQIGFWLASDGDSPNNLKLTFDGHALLRLTDLPREGWIYYSADATATGHDVLRFSFRDDGGYLALDSVSVRPAALTLEAVPEPASVALLGVGVAALAWRRRSKEGLLF
jgi:hypothetical protein